MYQRARFLHFSPFLSPLSCFFSLPPFLFSPLSALDANLPGHVRRSIFSEWWPGVRPTEHFFQFIHCCSWVQVFFRLLNKLAYQSSKSQKQFEKNDRLPKYIFVAGRNASQFPWIRHWSKVSLLFELSETHPLRWLSSKCSFADYYYYFFLWLTKMN